MKTIAVALGLLLTGCTASDQLPFQYVKGERVLIRRVSLDNPEIKGLHVSFHPTKSDAALVEPWNALSMLIRESPPGRWLAQIASTTTARFWRRSSNEASAIALSRKLTSIQNVT